MTNSCDHQSREAQADLCHSIEIFQLFFSVSAQVFIKKAKTANFLDHSQQNLISLVKTTCGSLSTATS